MSKNNVFDRRSLISSLYHDTFFNIYFRNVYTPTQDDEALPMIWVNFPEREMNRTYLIQIAPMTGNKVEISGNVMQIVPGQEGFCKVDYELGNQGEICYISGKVESGHHKKSYTKQFIVEAQNLKTDHHFTENVIL